MLQSARIRGSAGKPLPNPFKSLQKKGIEFLRGQFVMVAAGPGTGKSAFILTLALKSGVPCLYFSADSDAFIQLTRSISILKDYPISRSAEIVLNDEVEELVEDLIDIPIRFNYKANPTIEDIELSMRAYEEVYGDFPALVIIDNITNVYVYGSGGDDPFAGLEPLTDYISGMARNTEACVVGLHHVTGPYNDADKPIPLSGVKGQVSRVAAMILTLFRGKGDEWGDDTIGVSPVKFRGGKSDPSGYDHVKLHFNGDHMQIRDAALESEPASSF